MKRQIHIFCWHDGSFLRFLSDVLFQASVVLHFVPSSCSAQERSEAPVAEVHKDPKKVSGMYQTRLFAAVPSREGESETSSTPSEKIFSCCHCWAAKSDADAIGAIHSTLQRNWLAFFSRALLFGGLRSVLHARTSGNRTAAGSLSASQE